MPLIFIHGVNTREYGDGRYQREVTWRNRLLERLVLYPLESRIPALKGVKILNPYWGDQGANFAWNGLSVPKVPVNTERLGGREHIDEMELDLYLLDLLAQRDNMGLQIRQGLEALGGNQGILRFLAQKDLAHFLEAIVAHLEIDDQGGMSDEYEQTLGIAYTSLVEAAHIVSMDSNLKQLISVVQSDNEVLLLLEEALVRELNNRTHMQTLSKSSEESSKNNLLETLGPRYDIPMELRTGLGEVFARAANFPGRAATMQIYEAYKGRIHNKFATFLGDVFVYLNERGDRNTPGPIIREILKAFEVPRSNPNEPTIVITHSLGGIILYDLVTYYDVDLRIDCWISVGGQIGLFEEMKLLKASDKQIAYPAKVRPFKQQVGSWINIYDPGDILSFKVSPIFQDVDQDIEYLTGAHGLVSHTAYFRRRSLYQIIRKLLEGVLK